MKKTVRHLFQRTSFWALLIFSSVIAVSLTQNRAAGAGFALGVFGAIINLGATWGVVRLAGKAFANEPQRRTSTALIVAGFLAKLPIFVGFGLFAQTLGHPAMPYFLAGLGLVYSAMVGWVQAKS